MDKKALVLCGGGARGGYHVGVWKALKEVGYVPNIITGTSVGALNGALFSIGEEKLTEDIWKNMSMDTVFEKRDDKDINTIKSAKEFLTTIAKVDGIDPKPLRELINKLADEKKFRSSNIEFGLVTTRLAPKKKVEIFVDQMPEGRVGEYILASASCFPIMKKQKIDGVDYVDGGYSDNIPFRMAMARGANELVIVNMPGMFKLKKMEDVNAKVHYVFPKYDLGNFMVFNKETGVRDIKLGYLDTMKTFGKLEGNYFAFELGSGKEADKDSQKCREIFSRVFSGLPNSGAFEELAMNSMVKCIKEYNNEIFIDESNVLNVLEMAASAFNIDYMDIYSYMAMTKKVLTKYRAVEKTKVYKELLSLDKIKDNIKNNIKDIEKLKKVLKSYDIQNVIAYIVSILEQDKMTLAGRNQILAISVFMPEAVYAAIFIAANK